MTWDTVRRFDSAEGNVAKFVYEDKGDKPAIVESVLYKYPTYEDRTVICCSAQSGCPMGCRFCGTGNFFVRNLKANEIVEQVDHSLEETGVDPKEIKKLQVMFMSMGEPALNQDGICGAIEQLHDKYPNAKLLISTSAPDVDYSKIFEVSKKIDAVGLQFSVHESTDEARNELIPFKKKMTLEQIAQKGEEWYHLTGRKPYFNYCCHDKN